MNFISTRKDFFLYILSASVMVVCSMSTMSLNALVGEHHLGPDAVSVVNLVMPVSEFYYIFILLFAIPASITALHESAKNDSDAVSRHFSVVFFMTLAFSLLFTLLLFIFGDEVSQLLSADTSLQAQTSSYLAMMLPWFVIHNLLLVFELFMLVVGKGIYVLLCSLVQLVLNLLGSMLLMNFLEWGVAAFAISSSVSVEVAALLLLSLHLKNNRPFGIIFLSSFEFLSTLHSNLKIGFAFLNTQLVYILFSFLLNTLVVGLMGEDLLLCFSTVGFVFTFANYASLSGQMVCVYLGGKYLSEGNNDMFLRVFRWSYIFVTVWNVLTLLGVYLYSLFSANYPIPPYFILLTAPFIIINDLMGVYSLRLLFNGSIFSFVTLYAVIYLPLPCLFLLFHNLFPGYELYSLLVMIPIQTLEYYLSKRHLPRK